MIPEAPHLFYPSTVDRLMPRRPEYKEALNNYRLTLDAALEAIGIDAQKSSSEGYTALLHFPDIPINSLPGTRSFISATLYYWQARTACVSLASDFIIITTAGYPDNETQTAVRVNRDDSDVEKQVVIGLKNAVYRVAVTKNGEQGVREEELTPAHLWEFAKLLTEFIDQPAKFRSIGTTGIVKPNEEIQKALV